MASDHSRHQKGIIRRYYEHQDTIRSEKLSDLVTDLWICDNSTQEARLWKKVIDTLARMNLPAEVVQGLNGSRDIKALARLVQDIDAGRGPQQTTTQAPDTETPMPTTGTPAPAGPQEKRTIGEMLREKAAQAGTDSLEPENLKRAMQAFRKKLKTLRRDDESQVRGRYVTRGQSSGILAIRPPTDYPPAIWQELARQGRLKSAGNGLYQLP